MIQSSVPALGQFAEAKPSFETGGSAPRASADSSDDFGEAYRQPSKPAHSSSRPNSNETKNNVASAERDAKPLNSEKSQEQSAESAETEPVRVAVKDEPVSETSLDGVMVAEPPAETLWVTQDQPEENVSTDTEQLESEDAKDVDALAQPLAAGVDRAASLTVEEQENTEPSKPQRGTPEKAESPNEFLTKELTAEKPAKALDPIDKSVTASAVGPDLATSETDQRLRSDQEFIAPNAKPVVPTERIAASEAPVGFGASVDETKPQTNATAISATAMSRQPSNDAERAQAVPENGTPRLPENIRPGQGAVTQELAKMIPKDQAALTENSDLENEIEPEVDATEPEMRLKSPPEKRAVTAQMFQSMGDRGANVLMAASDGAIPAIDGQTDAKPAEPVQNVFDAQSVPRSGGLQSTAHTQPALANQIVAQVSKAIDDAKSTNFEITLDPEELGKVRIVMTPREAGISVFISADRPETLEMMRRNAEQLADNLADLGYSQSEFSFGDDQGAGQNDPKPSPIADLIEVSETQPEYPVHAVLSAGIVAGLDLKL